VRYVRILGYTSGAMSFLMFITAIGTHVRNHHPDYNRVDMMQLTMAMFNAERDVNPAGGGFIGFIILVTHCATSYSFSRPKRRRERIWGRGGLFFGNDFFKIESEDQTYTQPTVCLYRFYIITCAIGVAWGVALAIWDIMIASGQYYKAMADGDTVQAFLFMEAALGIMMTCVCTTSILLVYHACRCDGPGSPRKRLPQQQANHYAVPNTISRGELDTTAVTWNQPRLPEGEAPPVYADSNMGRARQGHVNPSFNTGEFHIQQPSQWI